MDYLHYISDTRFKQSRIVLNGQLLARYNSHCLKQTLLKSNESKMKNIDSTNIIYYHKLNFFSFFGNIIFGFVQNAYL